MGSGVRNVHKYLALYTKRAKPVFIEEDIFKTIIPLEPNIPKSSVKTSVKILDLTIENEYITIHQIAEILHRTPRAIENQISTLKDSEKIK